MASEIEMETPPMSTAWTPPRRAYHLRVFAVSLGLVVMVLAAFLFGVRMEAVKPANGIVTSRDLQEIRSLLSGLIEPGWYEAEVPDGDRVFGVRLDPQGDGITEPGGDGRLVSRHRIVGGSPVQLESLRFHRLQSGDELWPGQPLATIRADEWRLQLKQIEERLREWQSSGNHEAEQARARSEAELLRSHLSQTTLRVPETARMWLAVAVRASSLQAVEAGDVIATVVPIDPTSHQPLNLVARLEVDEKNLGDIALGQTAWLVSSMYNHRLHGRVEAKIERIEPWGEATPDGSRHYTIVAPIIESPFPMALGSSVKSEIVVGRKRVYRIILEH
jgi:hypothetical protein